MKNIKVGYITKTINQNVIFYIIEFSENMVRFTNNFSEIKDSANIRLFHQLDYLYTNIFSEE